MQRFKWWKLSALIVLQLFLVFADGQIIPPPLGCILPRSPSPNGTVLVPFVTSPVPIRNVYPKNATTATRKACDAYGRCIESYVLTAEEIQVDFGFRDERGTPLLTDMLSYNGTIPAPSIYVLRGVQTFVRFINHINCDTRTNQPTDNPNGTFSFIKDGITVHLHGSASLSPFDGWAEDYIPACGYKDYVYPNNGAAPLWYHDHAADITAKTVFYGLAGGYFISPCWLLPQAFTRVINEPPHYLMLDIKSFIREGDKMQVEPIFAPAKPSGALYPMVNGHIWPVVTVEPKVHVWTLLGAAATQLWQVSFNLEDGTPINDRAYVVGSDEGLRNTPAKYGDYISVAPGERWMVALDLTGYPEGTVIYMVNTINGANPLDAPAPGCYLGLLMKMIIEGDVEEHLPFNASYLIPAFYPYDAQQESAAFEKEVVEVCKTVNRTGAWDKHFEIIIDDDEAGNFKGWIMNFVDRNDLNKTTQMAWHTYTRFTPVSSVANAYEVWSFDNPTVDLPLHPMHIHPAKFLVCRRDGVHGGVMEYEWLSPKDTVQVFGGQQVWVMIWFFPNQGSYMFHCHNTAHEDEGLMGAFNASDPRAPLFKKQIYTKGIPQRIYNDTDPYTPNNTWVPNPLLRGPSYAYRRNSTVNQLQDPNSLPAELYKTTPSNQPPPITMRLLRDVLARNYYPNFYPEGRANLEADASDQLWAVTCDVCHTCTNPDLITRKNHRKLKSNVHRPSHTEMWNQRRKSYA